MRRTAPVLLLLAATMLAASAPAAVRAEDGGSEIVVNARRSGAPMWTIETDQGTVLLVGEITDVPKSAGWQPDRLEEATEGAQRVILGTKAKVSPGDIFRLIFKAGKLTKLPKGTQADDYLDAHMRQRLDRLEARFGQDYSRQNFLMTAFDLLSKRLQFNRDTDRDATDVVRKAARRADVPAEPVGTVRGEDILDNLFAAAPQEHLPCLEAAMTAVETGPQIIGKRGADWRQFNIAAVMTNPLEQAIGKCWPWADRSLGTELRTQWVGAITRAIRTSGVTLAVVPLRVLAERDGVLDQLAREGMDVRGPRWRDNGRR